MNKIEKVQKEMGLDITLRLPSGEVATYSNTGAFALYRLVLILNIS